MKERYKNVLTEVLAWSVVIVFITLCWYLLAGCTSTKSVEKDIESLKLSSLVERFDSLSKSSAVWQHDIWQKQISLFDCFKQKEKNDSNHSVVTNEKGDTVKEKIVIHHYIEREHNSESNVSEVMIQKFKEVDSLLKVTIEKQAETDSILRERNKVVIKEKSVTIWQKFYYFLIGAGIVVVLALIAWIAKLFYKRE